jgi:predicted PP-loop superfamily ATPase
MAYLADALVQQNKLDVAAEWVERAAALADENDVESQISWRMPRARLLARRGFRAQAAAVAREAVALADGTDDPTSKAAARVALAEVLELPAKTDEAAEALGQAAEYFEAKGHVTGAAEVRQRLAELPRLRVRN